MLESFIIDRDIRYLEETLQFLGVCGFDFMIKIGEDRFMVQSTWFYLYHNVVMNSFEDTNFIWLHVAKGWNRKRHKKDKKCYY